jgi:4a-hydroxytetrahydrobiopterin dehydratase
VSAVLVGGDGMATPACRISSRTFRRWEVGLGIGSPLYLQVVPYGNRGRSGTLILMDKPKILTAKELRIIMPRLSGWTLAQNKLSRTFEFQDFVQSLSFVNSLVAYFETVDHHPDVHIAYGEVTFELTRYDLGGKVTDRDVEVAKKISSEYRARA